MYNPRRLATAMCASGIIIFHFLRFFINTRSAQHTSNIRPFIRPSFDPPQALKLSAPLRYLCSCSKSSLNNLAIKKKDAKSDSGILM
jgi:hypothetical protein